VATATQRRLGRVPLRSGGRIFVAEYEQCAIGEVLFKVACNMNLEGIVSKRLNHGYCAGRCRHWTARKTYRIKIKNRSFLVEGLGQ
jgi:ATP-dependent DNA ligase